MLVLLGSRDLLLAVATGRWVAGEAQKQLPAEAVAGRCLDIVSGEGYCHVWLAISLGSLPWILTYCVKL